MSNDTLSESRRPGRPTNAEREARSAVSVGAGEHSHMPDDTRQGSASPLEQASEDRGPGRSRKPFGSASQKLAYPDRSGYHRHWFNDLPGRLDRAKEAGYDHVTDAKGPVNRVVGIAPGGGALIAYLMEIREEWYKEDMKAEQDRVDASDLAIRRGKVSGRESGDGEDKFYDTAQGRRIRIDRGR